MKKYPFNATENAHSIELRLNRIKNEMHEYFMGESVDVNQYDKMEALADRLKELLVLVMGGGIVYLPGEQFALARDTVAWADLARKNTGYTAIPGRY